MGKKRKDWDAEVRRHREKEKEQRSAATRQRDESRALPLALNEAYQLYGKYEYRLITEADTDAVLSELAEEWIRIAGVIQRRLVNEGVMVKTLRSKGFYVRPALALLRQAEDAEHSVAATAELADMLQAANSAGFDGLMGGDPDHPLYLFDGFWSDLAAAAGYRLSMEGIVREPGPEPLEPEKGSWNPSWGLCKTDERRRWVVNAAGRVQGGVSGIADLVARESAPQVGKSGVRSWIERQDKKDTAFIRILSGIQERSK